MSEIYVCINEITGISSFLKTKFNVGMVSLSDIYKLIKKNNKDYWLFVAEGCPDEVISKVSFVQDLIHSIQLQKWFVIAVFIRRIRAFNSISNAEWCRFSHHKDCGGATTAAFQVSIIPKHKFSKVSPSDHKWTLRDFAKPTVRRYSTKLPSNIDLLLQLSKWNEMHTLPSVFSATGWVSRRLTCFELLRCLDIPQQFDGEYLGFMVVICRM